VDFALNKKGTVRGCGGGGLLHFEEQQYSNSAGFHYIYVKMDLV
jgi:hypothetical protein